MRIGSVEHTIREILEAARTMKMRIDRGACGSCAFVHVQSWFQRSKDEALTTSACASLGISVPEAWAFMSGWDDAASWHSFWFQRLYGQNFNDLQREWWELGNRLAKEFCPQVPQ